MRTEYFARYQRLLGAGVSSLSLGLGAPSLRTLGRNRLVALAVAGALAAQPVLAATITVNAGDSDNDGIVIPNGDSLDNSGTINGIQPGFNNPAVLASGPIGDITNRAGGTINGSGLASGGIRLMSTAGHIVNNGTITADGTSSAALDVNGNITSFTNTGIMSAGNYNVVILRGFVDTIVNSGSITGDADTVLTVLWNVGSFNNSGTIRNTSLTDSAVFFNNNVATFVNSGTLEAGQGSHLLGGTTNGSNSGSILATGDATSYALTFRSTNGGPTTFVNTGLIAGPNGVKELTTNAANPLTFTNGGIISATAPGGFAFLSSTGDDTLTLLANSQTTGIVDMGGNTNGDTLILDGASGSATFDASGIGPAGQYRNIEWFRKAGDSLWTLTGNGTTGQWLIDEGELRVTGNLAAAMVVDGGGALSGGGTVGSVTVGASGRLSPGNGGVGTLAVTQGVVLEDGSVLDIEFDGNTNDLLAGGTTVDVQNGASLVLRGNASTACSGTTTRTFVTADGGVTGQFTTVDSSAFISATLDYSSANAIQVTITGTGGGGADFAPLGTTANQVATGQALDDMNCAPPYANELYALLAGEVPGALDALSGEAFASIAGAQTQQSSFVRDAVNDRVQQAFDALAAVGANSYAAGEGLDPASGAGYMLWGNVYGGVGTLAGNGNAAPTTSSAIGFVLGADGEFSDGIHLGFLAGAGASGVEARDTTASSTDLTAGVYGGADLGVVRIKFGAAYTRHLINSSRTIVFPGVNDTVTASYGAGTAQVFGEISKEIDLGAFELEPFANLALVNHATEAFSESGAPGALNVAASSINAAFLTLGLRAEHQFVLGDGMLVTARGSLGWRHAFADLPVTTNSFIGGGPFNVAAAPIAQDTLALGAELNFDISENLALTVGYSGEFGSGLMAHAVKATISGSF
jgi:fibronectin-binding autotransporter adhesin